MKKTNKLIYFTITLLITVFCVAGCSHKKNGGEQIAPPTIPASGDITDKPLNTDAPNEATPSPAPEPGTPNIIGLYINDSGSRKLVEGSHAAAWTAGEDIKCYEAVASNEKLLTGAGFTEIWTTCWNQFSNAKNTKIGYKIVICLKSGANITYDIKTPADTQQNRDYIETYLYDDVHQTPGQWYSHLEIGDVNNETVATSIKLTAADKITDIDKINLTSYLYTTDMPDRIITQYSIDVVRV